MPLHKVACALHTNGVSVGNNNLKIQYNLRMCGYDKIENTIMNLVVDTRAGTRVVMKNLDSTGINDYLKFRTQFGQF